MRPTMTGGQRRMRRSLQYEHAAAATCGVSQGGGGGPTEGRARPTFCRRQNHTRRGSSSPHLIPWRQQHQPLPPLARPT